MIDVDAASDLQLVSDLCTRPGSAAVVALARHSFAGKSLEYIAIVAEVRGVFATPAGHVDTFAFANAILAAATRLRSSAGQVRRIA
jgi:Zn-dependent protease